MRHIETPRSSVVVAILWLVAAAVYANSLGGVFVFDDMPWIADNPDIAALWPPWAARSGTLRPLLFWTLALNHAISGLDPWSYHVVNVAIHAAAASLLFASLRRLLRTPRVGWPEGGARGVAFATALLWLVHPLNTQAVTYTIQRGESLAGLLCLASVWALLRAADEPERRRWPVAVVGCWWLAMLTKESSASLPAALAAIDVFVLTGSPRASWDQRRGLWLALGAPVLLGLAAALAVAPAKVAGFLKGDAIDVTRTQYALTQVRVLAEYLRLSLWPHPLRIDYAWPAIGSWRDLWPAALPVAGLAAATSWAAWRVRPLALPGAWVVLLLAPTSSVVPLRDVLVEHRMYLPLAAVIFVVVIGVHRALAAAPRRGLVAPALLGGAVVVLGALTVRRNADYGSELAMFADPDVPGQGARRYYNLQLEFAVSDWGVLADLLLCTGNVSDEPGLGPAMAALGHGDARAAVAQLGPGSLGGPPGPKGLNLLGMCRWQLGDRDGAIEAWRQAVAAGAGAEARVNLAAGLFGAGQDEAAAQQLRAAAQARSDLAEASYGLGTVLAWQGHGEAALPWLQQALATQPTLAVAANNLGAVLSSLGRDAEARAHYKQAADRDHLIGNLNLGLERVMARDPRAVRYLDRVLAESPNRFRARNGRALVRYFHLDLEGARTDLEVALRLAPERADLHNNMGCVQFAAGQLQAAEASYRRSMQLDPELSAPLQNLGKLLVVTGRPGEAVEILRRAVALKPDDAGLRANLERARSLAR